MCIRAAGTKSAKLSRSLMVPKCRRFNSYAAPSWLHRGHRPTHAVNRAAVKERPNEDGFVRRYNTNELNEI